MCDFETNSGDIEITRVWAWGVVDISSPDSSFIYGNDITTFIKWAESQALNKDTLYFHNLKFDGDYLINWALKNGWTSIPTRKEAKRKTIYAVISGSGAFYQMRLYFTKNRYVTIIDSQKIINMGVDRMAPSFNLEEVKGEIDYELYREEGYEPTPAELDYLRRDVVIVAKSLHFFFDQGLTKTTAGANALYDYKIMMRDTFKYFFPDLRAIDENLRKSYKGGFTYVNPKYQGRDIGAGIVLDVNSLYPSRMYEELLPYGVPEYYEGEYEEDEYYPLYIQHITCTFTVKEGFLPTIQIKKSFYNFSPTEYLSDSDGNEVDLWLTSVDLKLFLDHYDPGDLQYIEGYKFRGGRGMFRKYIDKWMGIKVQAVKDKNKGLKEVAKVALNSLYGKFGKNPHMSNRIAELAPDGSTHYQMITTPDVPPVYIPMACFITAYARNYTIRAAQSCIDRFMYADTDSLHLEGLELPEGLEIDDTKLGAWKKELEFSRAKYLRAKCYIEEYDKEGDKILNIKCAGMPDKMHNQVTWDNFTLGRRYEGKLVPKHINGGTILVRRPFTIAK